MGDNNKTIFRMGCIILLFPHAELDRQSFYTRYITPMSDSLRLIAIGWEHVNSSSYRWDGLKRQAEDGAVFQFTLSGQGVIRYRNREYFVPEHCGFLCTVPGDHVYYFDEHDGEWEFMFIAVQGEDAIRHWNSLIQLFGPVISFQDHPEPMQCISRLYAHIYNNRDFDKFAISAELYRFVMELQRMAEGHAIVQLDDTPEPIRRSIQLMQSQYALPLTLEELAACAGMSRYHFCRTFHMKTGLQPMQYLRKVRIEKASAQLSQTRKTIETIARDTGFDGSSYFIRVFKLLVGMTPNEYRQSCSSDSTHSLRIEK
ncbi:AraC family transcriptional regulator [Paenibacillus ginsengarvi]|uniref:AraC family transcriptional regulator n=2 Tax=Paenibacillus ginsengarvi TaxID=400777 RepID=A0A3B0CMC3_9BACL|nr:AraC family transcriptional regulator [Paenibacillus ginsengarvi]